MSTVSTGRQFEGGQFNTLAQSGTKYKTLPKSKTPKTVKGKGTNLINLEVLNRRIKTKTITQRVVLSLIDVAKKKGNYKMEKAYWNTYHCQNKIVSSGNQFYGEYCKNRFCTVCSGIRKAEFINRYFPIIKTWEEPHFVTLTVKAVPAKKLNLLIKAMLITFKKIQNKHKKKHQRGKGIKLVGIKSLECNFNSVKKTYNPHFHIIVANKEMAEVLKKEWLWRCNRKTFNASEKAQEIRKTEDLEHDLTEIIKYSSKVFTDPLMKKETKQKTTPYIYVSALDNIFSAMKGHRIFDRFGFNSPQPSKTKITKSSIINQYDEWEFDPKLSMYINEDSNKLLSGFAPQPELIYLLENNINSELE